MLIGIVPRHAFDGVDVHSAPFNTAPIGTGPFAFNQWAPGDRLTLKANEEYWGGAPTVKRLVLAFAPDDHVRAARMERGDFDATHLPPDLAARFRNRTGLRVFDVPSADYRGVMFPVGSPVTGDPAIRLALDRAIDRDAIVQELLSGAGAPGAQPDLAGQPVLQPGGPARAGG